MELGSIVFLVALILLGLYAVSLYNNLVRIKHNVSKAW